MTNVLLNLDNTLSSSMNAIADYSEASGFDSTNNAVRFISLLLVFAFVLAITYFTTRFIAGYQKGKLANSNISIIETTRITQDKYIQIVKIGKRYVAIAVCKNEITKLLDLEEDDIVLNQDLEEQKNKYSGFLDVLEKIKQTKDKNGN